MKFEKHLKSTFPSRSLLLSFTSSSLSMPALFQSFILAVRFPPIPVPSPSPANLTHHLLPSHLPLLHSILVFIHHPIHSASHMFHSNSLSHSPILPHESSLRPTHFHFTFFSSHPFYFTVLWPQSTFPSSFLVTSTSLTCPLISHSIRIVVAIVAIVEAIVLVV